jgi:hypothetical protein
LNGSSVAYIRHIAIEYELLAMIDVSRLVQDMA